MTIDWLLICLWVIRSTFNVLLPFAQTPNLATMAFQRPTYNRTDTDVIPNHLEYTIRTKVRRF